MPNHQSSLVISEEHLLLKRLDIILTQEIDGLSRSLIKKFFKEGYIQSQDPSIKLELKKVPPVGTVILLNIPDTQETELTPQNIPLEILYEDEYLIIINKKAGIVVHPAPGNLDGTLVNAILYHCPNLSGVGNERRPGIVHRLDKGTSGVMVIAKEQKCHEGLVNLFSSHDIDRYYEAIVLGGRIPSEATIESTIGRNPNNRLKMMADVKNGKQAVTHMKVIEFFKHFSHVELKLETGRTHQIRVHLSQKLNAPIINDELYGRHKEENYHMPSSIKAIIKDYQHPFLHAKHLGFIHPIKKEKLEFTTPPPAIFQEVIKGFRNEA
jgi:23S rRNA pseudouridine1911/1915/1917 synthase